MKKTQSKIVRELQRAISQAEKRGISRYAIAKAAGMPASQIGRIASGESIPLIDTAERVLKAIGCKLVIKAVVAR